MTVNVRPATIAVPVRWLNPEFDATVKATGAVPCRVPLPITFNQLVVLDTVHVHEAPDAVTVVDAVPVLLETFWLVGEIEYVHEAPLCTTVKV